MSIINKLRHYRVKKILTQKKLASISGVCQVTISFIENNLSEPMDLTKQKLANALEIPVEEVFPQN